MSDNDFAASDYLSSQAISDKIREIRDKGDAQNNKTETLLRKLAKQIQTLTQERDQAKADLRRREMQNIKNSQDKTVLTDEMLKTLETQLTKGTFHKGLNSHAHKFPGGETSMAYLARLCLDIDNKQCDDTIRYLPTKSQFSMPKGGDLRRTDVETFLHDGVAAFHPMNQCDQFEEWLKKTWECPACKERESQKVEAEGGNQELPNSKKRAEVRISSHGWGIPLKCVDLDGRIVPYCEMRYKCTALKEGTNQCQANVSWKNLPGAERFTRMMPIVELGDGALCPCVTKETHRYIIQHSQTRSNMSELKHMFDNAVWSRHKEKVAQLIESGHNEWYSSKMGPGKIPQPQIPREQFKVMMDTIHAAEKTLQTPTTIRLRASIIDYVSSRRMAFLVHQEHETFDNWTFSADHTFKLGKAVRKKGGCPFAGTFTIFCAKKLVSQHFVPDLSAKTLKGPLNDLTNRIKASLVAAGKDLTQKIVFYIDNCCQFGDKIKEYMPGLNVHIRLDHYHWLKRWHRKAKILNDPLGQCFMELVKNNLYDHNGACPDAARLQTNFENLKKHYTTQHLFAKYASFERVWANQMKHIHCGCLSDVSNADLGRPIDAAPIRGTQEWYHKNVNAFVRSSCAQSFEYLQSVLLLVNFRMKLAQGQKKTKGVLQATPPYKDYHISDPSFMQRGYNAFASTWNMLYPTNGSANLLALNQTVAADENPFARFPLILDEAKWKTPITCFTEVVSENSAASPEYQQLLLRAVVPSICAIDDLMWGHTMDFTVPMNSGQKLANNDYRATFSKNVNELPILAPITLAENKNLKELLNNHWPVSFDQIDVGNLIVSVNEDELVDVEKDDVAEVSVMEKLRVYFKECNGRLKLELAPAAVANENVFSDTVMNFQYKPRYLNAIAELTDTTIVVFWSGAQAKPKMAIHLPSLVQESEHLIVLRHNHNEGFDVLTPSDEFEALFVATDECEDGNQEVVHVEAHDPIPLAAEAPQHQPQEAPPAPAAVHAAAQPQPAAQNLGGPANNAQVIGKDWKDNESVLLIWCAQHLVVKHRWHSGSPQLPAGCTKKIKADLLDDIVSLFNKIVADKGHTLADGSLDALLQAHTYRNCPDKDKLSNKWSNWLTRLQRGASDKKVKLFASCAEAKDSADLRSAFVTQWSPVKKGAAAANGAGAPNPA